MKSKLFQAFQFGPVGLKNRLIVSPMCQYSCRDGSMTSWHHAHLGALAVSGASLLMFEATHVSPEGRITHGCAGLYGDDNEQKMKNVVSLCREVSDIKLGVQLSHAGRKGSVTLPWQGARSLPADDGAWTTHAPSAIPFADWQVPSAMQAEDFAKVLADFSEAARRAARIGFDVAELHMAHGYLLNEFLSPLTNRRTDDYGGSLDARMRFPLQVFDAVRKIWPAGRALGAKIPGSDYADGGFTASDAAILASRLKALGADYVNVSGGGLVANQIVPKGDAINAGFAATVREASGILTGTVGAIATAEVAEAVLQQGRADFIVVGRAFLSDPRWGWRAAAQLGEEPAYPPQYNRISPKNWLC